MINEYCLTFQREGSLSFERCILCETNLIPFHPPYPGHILFFIFLYHCQNKGSSFLHLCLCASHYSVTNRFSEYCISYISPYGGGGVIWCLVPNWLFSLALQELVFTACAFFFILCTLRVSMLLMQACLPLPLFSHVRCCVAPCMCKVSGQVPFICSLSVSVVFTRGSFSIIVVGSVFPLPAQLFFNLYTLCFLFFLIFPC